MATFTEGSPLLAVISTAGCVSTKGQMFLWTRNSVAVLSCWSVQTQYSFSLPNLSFRGWVDYSPTVYHTLLSLDDPNSLLVYFTSLSGLAHYICMAVERVSVTHSLCFLNFKGPQAYACEQSRPHICIPSSTIDYSPSWTNHLLGPSDATLQRLFPWPNVSQALPWPSLS